MLMLAMSIICAIAEVAKDTFTSTIPSENWANEELYHKDIMDGVPIEQRLKNLKNGKYKLIETHTEPHRDHKNGKIIIDDYKLYREDVNEYGAYKAQQWAKQGKYNL